MNILDVLSPLSRHKGYTFILFAAVFLSLYALSGFISTTYKTTLFYTVIPAEKTSFNNHSYATEGAERATETIAGWTKNPGFREKILQRSGIPVQNFKRKITARKQNKLNLVVSLTTSQKEYKSINTLSAATSNVFEESLSSFNNQNAVQFKLQGPDIYSQSRQFPLSWILAGCFLLALVFSLLSIYLKELLADKVSFFFQLEEALGKRKILRISGKEDAKLLASFEKTISKPEFIVQGLTAKNAKLFKATDIEKINPEKHTPVFVFQMGKTTMKDVQNLVNTFEENSAAIIFD